MHRTRATIPALIAFCLVQAGCGRVAPLTATGSVSSSGASGARPGDLRPSGAHQSASPGSGGSPGAGTSAGHAGGSGGGQGAPGGSPGGGATTTANAPFTGTAVGTTSPPPTPGLDALYKAITVTSRSVSAVVHAPAGLPVTNPIEISVLFGDRRLSQNYDSAAGTTIAFDYPVGDGRRRGEMLTINLTEHSPGGTVPYHYYRLVTIEARWEVVISDLTFTLLNDCNVVEDSEPVVDMGDDRGVIHEVHLSMSADQVVHLHQLSSFVPAATVSDGLMVPSAGFYEDQGLGHFYGQPPSRVTNPPLLPGTSRHVSYDQTDSADPFCSAHFDYVIGIDLLTFHTP